MPLPVGVPRVTVSTGPALVSPGGTPLQGRIVFVGPDLVVVPSLDLTLDGAEAMELTAGVGSVDLIPSDIADMNPRGWTYEVRSDFTNAPNWVRYIRLTLAMAGTTVKLADVLVPDPVTGAYTTLIDPSTLGTAAFADIGTAAGTVAAGNDSRLSDSRTPSGAASGDLSGTYPGPTVAAVRGVALSATAPTSGQVLTASSGSAAGWQTPAGGGASVRSQGDDRIDVEIVTLTNTGAWTVVRSSGGTAIGKSVKAAAGDRVLVIPAFMYAGNQYQLDLAVMASNGTSVTRYASSSGSSSTPGPEGFAPLYTQAASFPHSAAVAMFTVATGEVDGSGLFTVNLAYIAPSLSGTDQKIYAGAGYLARWIMMNLGPEPA